MHTIQEILNTPLLPYGVEDHDKIHVLNKILPFLEYWPKELYSMDDFSFLRLIKVEMKAHRRYDHDRSASVFVVKFNDIPFVVASLAGRAEEDSKAVYVLDKTVAKLFLESLVELREDVIQVDPTMEIIMPDWGGEVILGKKISPFNY